MRVGGDEFFGNEANTLTSTLFFIVVVSVTVGCEETEDTRNRLASDHWEPEAVAVCPVDWDDGCGAGGCGGCDVSIGCSPPFSVSSCVHACACVSRRQRRHGRVLHNVCVNCDASTSRSPRSVILTAFHFVF